MLEVPLTMVAWMSVVLFQAIVHFGLIGPRRMRRTESFSLPVDGSTEDETAHLLDGNGLLALNESEEDDEPENFRRLLSQTGSELVNVSPREDSRSGKPLQNSVTVLSFFLL